MNIKQNDTLLIINEYNGLILEVKSSNDEFWIDNDIINIFNNIFIIKNIQKLENNYYKIIGCCLDKNIINLYNKRKIQ